MFSYMDSEDFEKAVIDYEKVCKLEKTRGTIGLYKCYLMDLIKLLFCFVL